MAMSCGTRYDNQVDCAAYDCWIHSKCTASQNSKDTSRYDRIRYLQPEPYETNTA
jgi:hypothetical protein